MARKKKAGGATLPDEIMMEAWRKEGRVAIDRILERGGADA